MPAPVGSRSQRQVRRTVLATSCAVSLALAACADTPVAPARATPSAALGVQPAAPNEIIVPQGDPLGVFNGVPINRGGYGSALAVTDGGTVVYTLTDRGANVVVPGGIGFGVPTFTPQIGKFRLSGTTLTLERRILLRQGDGTPLSGLPQPNAEPARTEQPFTLGGAPLPFDPLGIDSEGLAFARDGSFWISDEYGPDMVHFDQSGRTLQRLRPGAGLPMVLAHRRTNRGMEGLTITRNDRTVVGMMQSPLDNPTAGSTSAGRGSRLARLVFVNWRDGTSRQHAYLLEAASLLNSEIVAVSPTRFLVIERDSNFPNGAGGGAVKKIYLVDVTGATDISDPLDRVTGLLVGPSNLTLEELTNGVADPAAVLIANGITPVSKAPLVDVLTEIPTYPHDKLEGLAIVDDWTLAISNDDDFGVGDDGAGHFIPKGLPSRGNTTDFNSVYLIRLAQPLHMRN